MIRRSEDEMSPENEVREWVEFKFTVTDFWV
jgi:hypothetical protein